MVNHGEHLYSVSYNQRILAACIYIIMNSRTPLIFRTRPICALVRIISVVGLYVIRISACNEVPPYSVYVVLCALHCNGLWRVELSALMLHQVH